jgi:hypothetical protein
MVFFRERQPHRERAAAPGSPSELVVTQLVNKSTSADLRAIKLLTDIA